MATKVMMEALSPTMEEGRLVKWLKNVGDAVKTGETIAEVETDKAIMELVARGDGILRARLVEEGATSAIGETLAVIATADEDISKLAGGATAVSATAVSRGVAEPTTATAGSRGVAESAEPTKPSVVAIAVPPAAVAPATAVAPPAAVPSVTAAPPRETVVVEPVRSSPLARRLATERGIALDAVHGSGPNGRIIRRDIESATSAVSDPIPASVVPSPQQFTDVPLTQIRKTIARRLSESIGPIPTFYLTSEIDMTQVGKLREQMLAAGDQFKVSVNDIVLKAVATALTRHPECNAHWLTDHIRYFTRVHLGMAVATDDGLIVPVITDAQNKGLGQIGREARDFAKRARERKLTPAEYTGSTFSVSNLGMFGIDQFTAIINPPEAAILAIGSTETKPVWENGAFVPRLRMRVTMSCDHRVIDGAVGARFLQTVRQLLEAPMMMLF